MAAARLLAALLSPLGWWWLAGFATAGAPQALLPLRLPSLSLGLP